MADDEPTTEEPTTGERTQTERLASAAERAAIATDPDGRDGHETDKAADADEAAAEADKTDMGAVGDDGQVFGG